MSTKATSTYIRKKRAARRAQQKRIRQIAFGVIALLVLGTAGYLLIAAFSPKGVASLPPAVPPARKRPYSSGLPSFLRQHQHALNPVEFVMG